MIEQLQKQEGVEGVVVEFLPSEDGECVWAFCVPGYTDADGVLHMLLTEREQVEDALADYACCVGISQYEAFKNFVYDALYAEVVYKLGVLCKENSREV